MDYAQLVQDVIDGNESALKGLALLKKQREFIDLCIEKIEPDVQLEIEKYTEKQFEAHGFSFEIRKGGAIYDFKGCPDWIEVNNKQKEIEAKLKAAAKAYETGKFQQISEDGEIIVLPKVTYRKDSVIIK